MHMHTRPHDCTHTQTHTIKHVWNKCGIKVFQCSTYNFALSPPIMTTGEYAVIASLIKRTTHTHLVSYDVEVLLEAVLHLPGEVGAVGSGLLHLLLLLGAGEVEGEVVGEQVVDPSQERAGHRLDALQRLGKVLLALPGQGNRKQAL